MYDESVGGGSSSSSSVGVSGGTKTLTDVMVIKGKYTVCSICIYGTIQQYTMPAPSLEATATADSRGQIRSAESILSPSAILYHYYTIFSAGS